MPPSAAQGITFVSVTAVCSLAVFAIQRALHPLYGSAPTGQNIWRVIGLSSVAGALLPAAPDTGAWVAAVWLLLSPQLAYYSAVWTSENLQDAVQGPLVCLGLLLPPVIYGSASRIKQFSAPGFETWRDIGIFYWNVSGGLSIVWQAIPALATLDNDQLLFTLGAVAFSMWAATADWTTTVVSPPAVAPKSGKGKATSRPPPPPKEVPHYVNMVKLVVGALLGFASYSTRPGLHPLTTPWTHPTQPVRILSSVQSVTGLVVVGEVPASAPGEIADARYLRVDHSLLGGVWTGEKVAILSGSTPPTGRDMDGTPLGDSIYSTFVLQEAALLVEGTSPKTALTIGLGSGISTQAFQRHGLATTIIEIDPAVYNASRMFFGLADPGPDRLFLEDARAFVNRRKDELEQDGSTAERFDVVVHDCFSGGGVPGHIFTREFWDDLKGTMTPEGVLAVNFAGAPGSKSAHAIMATLGRVFGQCRAFHDYTHEISREQLSTEFVNMVFFCRASGLGTGKAPTFRAPKDADFLGSYLRRFMLGSFQEREVPPALVMAPGNGTTGEEDEWVLTDAQNPLPGWQSEGAMEHWKVMQQVLPPLYWRTY